MQKVKFRVVIRGRNCQVYLRDCLDSLIKQTYSTWKATIVLDAPQDGSLQIAQKYARRDRRISVHVNKKHIGVAANVWKGIFLTNANDEDVIAILDADDELYINALEIVAKEFAKNPKLLATYGSYWRFDMKKRTKTSRPYKKNKPVRKQTWHGSHLKTFKFKLMKHVPKECLKDSKGEWYQAASDLALMIPILELAGLDRAKHISRCIYKWRRTPYKTRGHLQLRNKREIRKKKPLKRVEF